MNKFKYIAAFIIPLLALISFYSQGILAYSGIFVLFVIIPIIEHNLPKNSYNLEKAEKSIAAQDFYYDFILFLSVPIHLFVIYEFLSTVSNPDVELFSLIAYILTMGTILGSNGISIGHELGHKTNDLWKSFLAHIMLLSSLQNHFVPYHNGGHHKDIGTPEDLTSAQEGDIYYVFAIKSQIGGYFKTWFLEHQRLKSKGKNLFFNPMIVYTLLPVLLLMAVYYFYDLRVLGIYFCACVIGISILEAQNYFAHYGLRRKKLKNGLYERVQPKHSWNSDHLIGRIMLFELTRHSDHHHRGAKPYQLLDSKENSPNLPFGYPAMVLLCFFPFLFIPIMKKQLNIYKHL